MKIKFRQYENEYEKVFSNKKRVEGKCRIELITPFEENPKNTALYIKKIQETIRKLEMDAFDSLVKFEWLKRRFCVDGHHLKGGNLHSYLYKMAYGNFMRYYVGYNNRFYFTNSSPFNEVFKYLDDFFPDFELGDPFKEKYKYPFSLGLDCLGVVSRMEERMDLLKFADSKKMNYAEFLDYVINYILCYNDEHGEKYRLILSQSYYPYVKILKNEETSSVRPRTGGVLPPKFVRPKCYTTRHVGGSNKPKRIA